MRFGHLLKQQTYIKERIVVQLRVFLVQEEVAENM